MNEEIKEETVKERIVYLPNPKLFFSEIFFLCCIVILIILTLEYVFSVPIVQAIQRGIEISLIK